MTRRLVVATRSGHKLREIRDILGDLPGYEVVDLDQAGIPELPEEEGVEAFDTFVDNALAKARYFAARSRALVLADDSGLCVDALGGAPGVRSKRFSGRSDLRGAALDDSNNAHLLRALRGVPAERRAAHYVCVAALVDPSGDEHVFEGRCDGVVLDAPRGSGGFGYDPLFFLPDEGATFGELPPERKDRVSHRARAMSRVARFLSGRPDGVDTPPRNP